MENPWQSECTAFKKNTVTQVILSL